MKYSVCIDAVYSGKDPIEAIREVKAVGLPAVEFWSWWDKDLDSLKRVAGETGVEVAAFCTGFVSLVDESKREEYIEFLKRSIEAARKLNCKTLISQTGADMGIDRALQRASLVEGLRACAPLLEEAGVTLVIEPLNTRVDHAGYYLSSSDECADILREVGSSNVKMLYDIYHQQITEGDLIRRIKEYAPLIGHFHAAGNPGRHELYNSEIDYAKIFAAIRETGYDGYVGLEYFPVDEVEKGFEFAGKVMGYAENRR